MTIFPSIDLRQGRVVRLEQGRADREVVYFDDPREPAMLWRRAGAKWVHVVDLDGAFSGDPVNLKAVEAIASCGLRVEFGGGLRRIADVEAALSAGADRIVIGTRAAVDRAWIDRLVDRYSDRVVVGIDARGGRVAVKGWVDTTEENAIDMAVDVAARGVRTIVYTDIARDGMLSGPNFEGQRLMLEAVQARVIASGGVASATDIKRFHALARTHPNLDGVIVGKALYDHRLDLAEALAVARSG